MARIKTEFELDEELLRLVDVRADATGKPRAHVVEEALRRQLQPSRLAHLIAEVRSRSDLTEEQATALAYAELDAMRAERSSSASV